MRNFRYYQPTEIIFGPGSIKDLGEKALQFGEKSLLVTTEPTNETKIIFDRVKNILKKAGVAVTHFDQVQPNPTTEIISAGTEMALACKAEMIIGMGGGSSIDSAKAIAVEATHEGLSWDYLYFRETQPSEKTLPIIAISTTSGTGSQVTQVAVVTNTQERNKSAIYNPFVFPRVSFIDPEFMLTVPEHVTASTGFDVFCHAFESMLHPNASHYTNLLALEAIHLVVQNLPFLLTDLSNLKTRTRMAYADTLAGLCIANAGVTLPHGIGMAVSGMYPHVMHGESLAIVYPAFARYTYRSAVHQFAAVSRILNSDLTSVSEELAAEGFCKAIDDFLKKIGMWMNFKDVKMSEDEIDALAKQSMVLPDYKANPRVANFEEMRSLISQSYDY